MSHGWQDSSFAWAEGPRNHDDRRYREACADATRLAEARFGAGVRVEAYDASARWSVAKVVSGSGDDLHSVGVTGRPYHAVEALLKELRDNQSEVTDDRTTTSAPPAAG